LLNFKNKIMPKINLKIALLLIWIAFYSCSNNPKIAGTMHKWQPITLTFEGPIVSEESNTFRNYKLDVTFTHGQLCYTIPGYFTADGDAANTSASKGNKWRVIFTPPEHGKWNYSVSFKQGENIVANENVKASMLPLNGKKGSFFVNKTTPYATGFYKKGMLNYVGERYLQFAETGEWFIKAGAGGPENFLGFIDFDSTYNIPGGINDSALGYDGLHKYAPHLRHWEVVDPTWKNGKGKAIIGAVNYMALKGLNTLYMVTNNVNGDGRDCWPWTSYEARDIYDVSKLDQWNIVFSHMNAKGIQLDFYLWESENTRLLNNGDLGIERKIYYREMIARFGHLPAIRWNISEEPTTNPQQILADADYIKSIDAYHHAVGVHCGYTVERRNYEYPPLLGQANFDGAWMQVHNNLHQEVKRWINKSDSAGHKWVVSVDESLPNHPWNTNKARKEFWEIVTAGGEGYDVYFGYGTGTCDIANEDYGNRDTLWNQLAIGLELFSLESINPLLPKMKNHNELGTGRILALPGQLYIIYLVNQPARLDLTGITGLFNIKWLNPITGGELQTGSVATVNGGQIVGLGSSPTEGNEWVIMVKKADKESGQL